MSRLYRGQSLVPSRLAECARYQGAVGGEVSRHLMALPGVQSVSAVVSVPACDPLAAALGTAGRPSASVVLSVSGDEAGHRPDDIVELVAAAVDGLTREQVVVKVAELPTPGELVKQLKSMDPPPEPGSR